MLFTKDKEKTILIALVALLVLLIVYRVMTKENLKTAPLTFTRGAVAELPMRQGILSRADAVDPLKVFLEQRERKFPGITRDLFRMESPASRPKPKALRAVVTAPTPTVPVEPVKTPEQVAGDLARAELSKFRFLGYLTDKDNTLFLSKEGELFMVKSGGRLLKNYRIKEAGKDFVVLADTVTGVEVKVELSGSEQAPPQQRQQQPPPQQQIQQQPHAPLSQQRQR